jgi:two-component system, sensor histidine kinase SagS
MAKHRMSTKILCLGSAASLPLVDALAAQAEIVAAETPEEIREALADDRVVAVLADPETARQMLDGRATGDHAVVLDALSEGVSITDTEGHIQWSNPAFRALGAELAERVMRFVQRVARRLEAGEATGGKSRRYSTRERTAAGLHCEVTVTPILDANGRPARMVAVAMDRTAQIVLQQKIGAIDEAGRRLMHLEPDMVSRMTPDERLTMLQKQLINLTRNLLKFDHFRIRLRDPANDRLELVLTEDRKPTLETRELFAAKEGSGITGYVAATGQPYICNDVRSDPRYLPWLAEAHSSLTVPLWHQDKVVGTFNVESDQVGAFGQQDLQALEIFSHYVAQALVTLQLLIAEKVSTTEELAADVTGELSEPLDSIVAAANVLRANYVGHDKMTIRQLREITENVDRVRQAVRQVTDVKRPVTGTQATGAKSRQPLAGRRVLVADDEPTIRETLSQILSDLGATVDLAADGQEAVDLSAKCPYDLLLADIRMPHKNGYEVFAEVRELHPRLPVILMTAFGYDPSHSIVRAGEEGLQTVLFKPFKIQVLYEEIGNALGIKMELSA